MPLDLTPSGLVEASKCYCYTKDVAQRVNNYLWSVISGNNLSPSELAAAASCYCYDAKTAKAVLISELCDSANDAGDSALVTCDGAFLANAAKCYCFDHATAERVKIRLMVELANLSALTPTQLASAAACYCLDHKTSMAVPLYALCNPGEEPEPPGPPVETYRCPDVPVTLKAYYRCDDASGGYVIHDAYADRHLISVNDGADPPLISVNPGKIVTGLLSAAGTGPWAGFDGTAFDTKPDGVWWNGNSFTVRLWAKTGTPFGTNTTGISITWGNFWLKQVGTVDAPGSTAWVVSYYTAGSWHDFGGFPNVLVQDSDWHRIVCWYCDITGDVGLQIDNNAPTVGDWPAGIGLAGQFNIFLGTVGGPGTAVVDEIAFWRGWLTVAQLLDDWNSGAGKTLPDVPGTGGAIPTIATTVTLTSSKNPAALGDTVRFTASVSGWAAGGTVQFREGVTVLGTVAYPGGTNVSLDVTNFTVGDHDIKAYYSGDGYHLASESAVLTQSVVTPGTGGVWPDGPFYVDSGTLTDLNAGVGDVTGVLADQGGGQYAEIATYGGFQLTAGGGTWTLLAAWNTWGNTGTWTRDGSDADPRGTYSWSAGDTFTDHPPDKIIISNTP